MLILQPKVCVQLGEIALNRQWISVYMILESFVQWDGKVGVCRSLYPTSSGFGLCFLYLNRYSDSLVYLFIGYG
jgi:hypothetical protein